MPWPLRRRIVEIRAELGRSVRPRYRYGSGFLVGDRWVLTAAHVVSRAVAVRVRASDKSELVATLDPAWVAQPDLCDVAILELTDLPVSLEFVPVAIVDRDTPSGRFVEDCWAVGFPVFQEVDEHGLPIRKSAQVGGRIAPLSNLDDMLLSLHVEESPEALPPGETLEQSPWSGMSGAPVFAEDALVGVVAAHARRRGLSDITVTPLEFLSDADRVPGEPAAWWERLGVRDPSSLPRLPPPVQMPPSDDARRRPWARLHQLPVELRLPDFVGRVAECAALLPQSESRAENAAPDVRIVFGPGGVGKTSLVVHALERNSADFPDGELFVDLQGYGPHPLSPAEALDGWLRDLGLEGQLIPAGVAERSREFRSRLAGRRVAVVIDNAPSEANVRPLLIAGSGSVNFVTSRDPLGTLAASARIELGDLPVSESVELLSEVLGAERVEDEADKADELARACGCLPLALRVVAGTLVSDPRPFGDFLSRLERLRDERRLLSAFVAGDLSVEASFALSREALSPAAQIAFDMLGVHPASEWSDWSVAALFGMSLGEAQDLLGDLVRKQLVRARVPAALAGTRYYMHDLVHEFAREQATHSLSGDSRAAALSRVASAYLSVADAADRSIHPSGVRHQGRVDAPRYAVDAEFLETGSSSPFTWFGLERTAVMAVVTECHHARQWSLCWELADAASVAFENLRSWDTAARCAELGFAAATQLGSKSALAAGLRNLGEIDRELGEHDRAAARLEESVGLFDEVGDLFGATDARVNLALVQLRWGDPLLADENLSAALATAGEAGDVRGEAWALEIRGECAMILGRGVEGRQYLRDAAALFEAHGEWRGLAMARFNEALLVIDDMGWSPLPPVDSQRPSTAPGEGVAEAHALLDEAAKVLTDLGDARNMAVVAIARARLAILEGNDREAARRVRTARSLEGLKLDNRLRGLLVHCDSVICHRSGRLKAARAKCEEAIALVQPYGDRLSTASLALHLALLARAGGANREAAACCSRARSLFEEIHRPAAAERCGQLPAA